MLETKQMNQLDCEYRQKRSEITIRTRFWWILLSISALFFDPNEAVHFTDLISSTLSLSFVITFT